MLRRLWLSILRRLMPAEGAHSRSTERRGLDAQDFWTELHDEYDEYSPEDEPDPDPYWQVRETRQDFLLARPYIPRDKA